LSIQENAAQLRGVFFDIPHSDGIEASISRWPGPVGAAGAFPILPAQSGN